MKSGKETHYVKETNLLQLKKEGSERLEPCLLSCLLITLSPQFQSSLPGALLSKYGKSPAE